MKGNADTASSAAKLTTARTISLGGNLSGSASFDGTGNITIAGQVNTVRDSNNGNAIKITYSKSGQSSTSWLGSWNGYELGAISPANITAGAASKLTSNAGSATQPVYFTNGVPTACTYTLGKSVPSNAVFTDTNNKVTQTAVTASDYTNWRPIVWGASNSNTEGFTPTTTTDGTFTTSTLSVQPSSGTIRATTFKGALSGNASTASVATKLGTSAGSATQPVYFSDGKPVACTYTVNKSVPANAVFTDTIYTLPAAGSTLGGVKTTSTVTSASGYTACPIISGVPYYKDTNTTYSLSSFGINASATELNYTKGVTSAIQTQLNGKAASSHTHNYAGSSSAGGSANSAVKLDTSAGSASLPVYFSNGKPVAISTAIRSFFGSLASNGWKSLGGREYWNGVMVAYNNANNTSWNSQTYSSTLVFGAADTKGMLDLGYSSPIVVFGGSNADGGNDNNPNWYFKLSGTNGATYTYPTSSKALCASDGSNASGSWNINASSAAKLDTSSAGSATQPVYFTGGKPVACTYTLGKSVPSDAKFTDTVYTLPTASSSTLGGVKTTSTVTSNSGYTACPIINGVPYYKDTNTTYSLSSFGISASAAEINYTKGVTSAIQTQLNGKVPTSRTVNGKALSANITLSASDVGAAASGHTHNKTATATLSASKWSNKSQSVSVSGVTASNTVIVTAAPGSYTKYCESSVYCSAQGSGTLTFTCDTVPTADITANIVILGG